MALIIGFYSHRLQETHTHTHLRTDVLACYCSAVVSIESSIEARCVCIGPHVPLKTVYSLCVCGCVYVWVYVKQLECQALVCRPAGTYRCAEWLKRGLRMKEGDRKREKITFKFVELWSSCDSKCLNTGIQTERCLLGMHAKNNETKMVQFTNKWLFWAILFSDSEAWLVKQMTFCFYI